MRMTSYIDSCLDSHEIVVMRARYHWLANLRSFGLLNMFSGLVVTDRRILHKSGILATRIQSMALDQIESKDIEQTVPGRILGYGDVLIWGSGGKTFRFDEIARPVAVSRAIGRSATARQGGQAAARGKPHYGQP